MLGVEKVRDVVTPCNGILIHFSMKINLKGYFNKFNF